MLSERFLIKKDLNLLLVLVVLYRERNTEKTAERLFVTQSAISKGLKKLREQLNDPLFVRNRNGFVPTPLCDQLVSKIKPTLLSLEQLYSMSNSLNPDEYVGELSIAIGGAFGYAFGEKLYDCLQEDFPKATLNISTWSDATEQHLLDGKLQLGINYSPINISKDLKSVDIRPMSFKFLVRKNHPISDEIVSLKDIAQYPFVVPLIPNYTHKVSKLEKVLDKLQLPCNIYLRSDNENLCIACIKNSDAIYPVNDLTARVLSNDYSVLKTDFESSEYVPTEFAAIYYSDQFSATELSGLVKSSISKCLSFNE